MSGSGFTCMGKQILLHGQHYADACDDEAADFLLGALKLRAAIEAVWANHLPNPSPKGGEA